MSTRIHNGWICEGLESPHGLEIKIHYLQTLVARAARSYLRQQYKDTVIALHDLAVNKLLTRDFYVKLSNDSLDKSLRNTATWKEIHRISENERSPYRGNGSIKFEITVLIPPIKISEKLNTNFIFMTFFDLPDYKICLEQAGFTEFCYDNGSDEQLSYLTEEQWSYRGTVWDSVLDRGQTSSAASCGYTRKLIDRDFMILERDSIVAVVDDEELNNLTIEDRLKNIEVFYNLYPNDLPHVSKDFFKLTHVKSDRLHKTLKLENGIMMFSEE